ncbi:hypothetical protein BGZ76_009379 [Entomortierella beljakovae]|nr:hypothetical protein BGZ76_009379 [Entomortierella beljakovae]
MDQDNSLETSTTKDLEGQVVHARKCYKRLFFIDLRINDQSKCTILFRSDDSRQDIPSSLTDLELARLWKRVKCGDIIKLQVFEASEEESSRRDHAVYQAIDFELYQPWPRRDPFAPEPAMGLKQDIIPNNSKQSQSVNTSQSTKTSYSEPIKNLGNETIETGIAPWQDYCKFWINSQKCPIKNCPRLHPTGSEYLAAQEMWVRERTKSRKERSLLTDDPHSISSKVPHSQRAFIFCRWLVNKFGVEYLNSGSGVLDVAGGKGEISLFLTHMFGIRSTVVEPNVRRDKSYRRRNLMDIIKKQMDIEAGGDGQYFRDFKPSAVKAADTIEPDTKLDYEQSEAERLKERRRQKKLDEAQFEVPRISTLLDEHFAETHGSTLEGASAIIGMHPDQATEPIVDMALKHGKPFVVVPCCVFACDNPHRRLLNDGEVNTTLDFIQYLTEKAIISGASVSREFLPFDGMNIVVFEDSRTKLECSSVSGCSILKSQGCQFMITRTISDDEVHFKSSSSSSSVTSHQIEQTPTNSATSPNPIVNNSMTQPAYSEDVPPTTMSEAVNAVNAAIVAAVTARENAFSAASAIQEGGNSLGDIDATSVEAASRLKRTAEDDAEGADDNAKLRRLQEEVNNNANAAAGILSTSSTSNGANSLSTKRDSSTTGVTHTSGKSSKERSLGVSLDQNSTTSEVVTTATTTTTTTTHLTATSHSSIMADLERMQQLAKIDPAQLASYSTNPNNQATLEQLTSSALANVLAQAPLAVSSLQSNLQLQQEHERQHEQQQDAVQGILTSMPANADNGPANDSTSSHDDDTLSGKRSSRNMTNDERRQRRLLRNRVAAKECRKKKKAYVNELQDTCARLQEENARLYKEIEELNAKLTLGAMRIDENVRLIKEVEELNTKLTLGIMAGSGQSQTLVQDTSNDIPLSDTKLQDDSGNQETEAAELQTQVDQSQPEPQPIEASVGST